MRILQQYTIYVSNLGSNSSFHGVLIFHFWKKVNPLLIFFSNFFHPTNTVFINLFLKRSCLEEKCLFFFRKHDIYKRKRERSICMCGFVVWTSKNKFKLLININIICRANFKRWSTFLCYWVNFGKKFFASKLQKNMEIELCYMVFEFTLSISQIIITFKWYYFFSLTPFLCTNFRV